MKNENPIEAPETRKSFDRRGLLFGAGAAALVAGGIATSARAANVLPEDKAEKVATLNDTVHMCLATGQAALAHAMGMFHRGDSTLGGAAVAMSEMMAMCGAASCLAASESPRLGPVARLCGQSVELCEIECRKHAEAHPTCKECADACVECIAMIKKLPS